MRNKMRKYFIPIAATILYTMVVYFTSKETVVSNHGISLYIALGMLVPVGISIIQGLLSGLLEKDFRRSIPAITLTTVLIGGLSIFVSYIFIKNNWMDLLMENTAENQYISQSLNSELSIGVIIQLFMFVLMSSCIGTFIGVKLSNAEKNIIS